MPDSSSNTRIFLGEYHWAPAYQYFNIPYFSHFGWTRGWRNEIPKEIMPTIETYSHEGSGYDCSVDSEGYSIALLVKFIADRMNLKWKGIDGNFYDADNNLIAFDPSVREIGSQGLLVEKCAFVEFLNKHNLQIVWFLAGDKRAFDEERYVRTRVLDINGVYYLDKGLIKEKFNTSLEPNYKS
jgi:hypothetical protein